MENDNFNRSEGDNQNSNEETGNRELGSKVAQITGAAIQKVPDSQELKATSHEIAIEAVTRQLGEIRGREIAEAQNRIDRIEQYETMIMLESRGELIPGNVVLRDTLATKYGINAGLMTPEEASGLYQWVSDADKSVKSEKAEVIADTITRTLEGKHRRRDRGKFSNMEVLNHKFIMWERGEIDTSAPFDTAAYLPEEGEKFGSRYGDTADGWEYDEELDKGYAYGDYDDEYRFNETMIEDYKDGMIDDEELADLIDFDPGDKFVYGPFTVNDLDELEGLSWEVYVDAIDSRVKSSVGRLAESSIPVRSDNIITDLNNYYIGEYILPNRRLQARDLISSAAALGIESQGLLPKEDEKSASDEAKQLRKDLGWCSYYIARICQISPIENERNESQNRRLRRTYGRARPISGEFFSEALARSESWTEREADEHDKTYNAYLIHLEEWLMRVEADHEALTGPDKEETEPGVIPNIFATIGIDDRPQLPSVESEQE